LTLAVRGRSSTFVHPRPELPVGADIGAERTRVVAGAIAQQQERGLVQLPVFAEIKIIG